LFSIEKIQFDFHKNMLRRCTYVLGMTRGKWKSMESFTSLAILSSRQTNRMQSKATGTNYHNTIFRIFLLDETHIQKAEIYICNSLSSAESQAKKFSKLLDKPIKTYNPQIKSKGRRR